MNKNNDILVSVVCLTYNHVKYIRHAIESFIMQKTDFKFEIIIHDDASTDGTADIVREYGQKYPQQIITICQNENQCQKKVSIYKNFVCKLIKGKYIAMCEGDDYWSDPMKLQKQVEVLERNSDCHLCVHRVQLVHEDETLIQRTHPEYSIETQKLPPIDVIRKIGESYCFHTSSYLLDAQDFLEFKMTPPEFYKAIYNFVGDIPLILYMASKGNVYYIDEIMSCYRKGRTGSWSARYNKANIDYRIKFTNSKIEMIEKYDNFTKNKFHDICLYIAKIYEFSLLQLKGKYKELLKEDFKEILMTKHNKEKFYIYINAYFPFLASLLHRH